MEPSDKGREDAQQTDLDTIDCKRSAVTVWAAGSGDLCSACNHRLRTVPPVFSTIYTTAVKLGGENIST